MNVNEFTAADWECFSGAEEWADGSAPLIGETDGYVLVLDAGSVDLMDQDGDEAYRLNVAFPTQAAARAFAAGLPDGFDPAEYGFVNLMG